jgi:hypothetical protein
MRATEKSRANSRVRPPVKAITRDDLGHIAQVIVVMSRAGIRQAIVARMSESPPAQPPNVAIWCREA